MLPTEDEFVKAEASHQNYLRAMEKKRQKDFAQKVYAAVLSHLKSGEDFFNLQMDGLSRPEGDDWIDIVKSQCLAEGWHFDYCKSFGTVYLKPITKLGWFQKLFGV